MNRSTIRVIGALCSLLVLLSQCQPCEDCGPVALSPQFLITIQPLDSLASMEYASDTVRLARNAQAIKLRDTTAWSESQWDSIFVIYDSLRLEYLRLEDLEQLLFDNKTRLDSVWVLGLDSILFNQDTLVAHTLPLNPYADSTAYVIQHFDEYDTLWVTYRTTIYEDDYQVLITWDSLRLGGHTFDSTAYFTYGDNDQTPESATLTAIK